MDFFVVIIRFALCRHIRKRIYQTMTRLTSTTIAVFSFLLLLHTYDIRINSVMGKAIHVTLAGFNSHQPWHL